MNTQYQAKGLLGRTADGERVHVEIELCTNEGDRETVTHETVTNAVTLAISGAVTVKGRRDADSWGQCLDDAKRITVAGPGLMMEDVIALVEAWERWHLNTMKAGCTHQTVVWEDSDYGRRPSLTLTLPCPESGYKYGHAWLTEPLPDEVITLVRTIGDKLDGSEGG